MARRRIGQEALALCGGDRPDRSSTLDQLSRLIDWAPIEEDQGCFRSRWR